MTKNLRPPSFWLVLNQTGFPVQYKHSSWHRQAAVGKGPGTKAESLCAVALLAFTPGSVQETIAQVLLWDRVVHLGFG